MGELTFAVYGTGAVGGYFGGRLAEAGHDVRFIARGRHLAAIREHGLIRGTSLGVLRLLRCRPFGGHGFDPVPSRRA